MECIDKTAIVSTAWQLWNSGQEVEAGKLLYERIARRDRPVWAADVLQLAYSQIPTIPEIGAVITFARLPRDWESRDAVTSQKAHLIFENVRRVTRKYEHSDLLQYHLLLLAENVAKVTYNAYMFSAPFDHDAGWWIAACAKGIVTKVGDAGFLLQLWQTLANGKYITLESPIRCNPYCPTCNDWNSFSDITL